MVFPVSLVGVSHSTRLATGRCERRRRRSTKLLTSLGTNGKEQHHWAEMAKEWTWAQWKALAPSCCEPCSNGRKQLLLLSMLVQSRLWSRSPGTGLAMGGKLVCTNFSAQLYWHLSAKLEHHTEVQRSHTISFWDRRLRFVTFGSRWSGT